jgi:glutamyl-tRNA reductase
VELYATTDAPDDAVRALRDHLGTVAGEADLGPHLYEHTGTAAARHAFRVAASLDSLVVGEPQILGQVKDAFSAASDAGLVGPLLGRCMNRAFAVAKRVRTETGIAAGAVSVSTIACDLAKSIFGDLTGRRVVLVGAGEMGEGAAKALAQQGTLLTVVNRNQERARAVASAVGGEPREFDALAHELTTADVVITSTASPRYVITRELMQGVVKARRHRPLFLIDIAVPRDVDPRIDNMDNVFLFDVDDLEQVAQQNIAARRREAEQAERIVESEVAAFADWQRGLELTPTLVALRERVRTVVKDELARTVPRLKSLSEAEQKTLDAMGEAIVNKLLHRPLSQLKQARDSADGPDLIASVRKLFELDEPVRTDAQDAAASARDARAKTPSVPPLATTPTPSGESS